MSQVANPDDGPDAKGRFGAVLEHGLIFAGDILPFSVLFLLTLTVGYQFGIETASFLSLSLAYVTIVTSAVVGPSLLSLRRRMATTESPGAVVVAALSLRATIIILGAGLVAAGLFLTDAPAGLIPLTLLVFCGRFLETSVDGPATAAQYRRGAGVYFGLRLMVAICICGITAIGIMTSAEEGLVRIGLFYLAGSAVGLILALIAVRRLLVPVATLPTERREQASEFGKFFAASLLFTLASRIHPVIIEYFSNHQMAGQFAMIQNLFAVLALAATAIAGVFFWSVNRHALTRPLVGIPWRWLWGGMAGGLCIGVIGGGLLDLYLQHLGSSTQLRHAGWLLCLSTPLILGQGILSNALVLQHRDREMLIFSAVNSAFGLFLIAFMVYNFGLVGAALSVGLAALVTIIVGTLFVGRTPQSA